MNLLCTWGAAQIFTQPDKSLLHDTESLTKKQRHIFDHLSQ